MDAYSILTGVGTIYVAAAGTAMPAVNAAPSGSWRTLGETQDGVDVEPNDKIEKIMTDQRTGPVKAERTEETMIIKTKLAEATLENLADAMGVTLTDTAPGSGTIGTREVNLHRGAVVQEFAILFRGKSPYFNGNGQFYIP